MSIVLFVNLKGGVAKTTNAVAVAECLAESGYRTLLIDADHQCMSGELLLGEDRLLKCERRKTTLHDMMAELLNDDFKPEQLAYFAVDRASNIDGGLPDLSVIPCSFRIDDFATNMAKARRGHRSNDEFLAMFRTRRIALRKWLQTNYDFTIVDCPPSIAIQVKTLLAVGDSIIVPAIPDRLSVRGSLHLLDRIKRMGIKIDKLGTLWTLFRKQNQLHCKVIDAAARKIDFYGQLPPPFTTVIPNAAKIAEATEPGQSPKNFNAKYTAEFAKLYRGLCEEIITRSEWRAEAAAIGRKVAVAAE